jgi:hypothetical protein
MKQFLGVLIGIIAIIWIALKIFKSYDANTIMYNQASFEIYMDTEKLDINTYFGLTKDTFNIEKHKIVCLLPVEIQGFKPSSTLVRTNLNTIDCNATAQKGRTIDYEPYELKGTRFTLIVVPKHASTMMLDSPLSKSLVLGKKLINHNYSKGKINRLVVSGNGFYEYCK